MKKVYICSPLGGDVSANLERAKQYARYVFSCGAAPVVPHFYALVLEDGNPEERQIRTITEKQFASGKAP